MPANEEIKSRDKFLKMFETYINATIFFNPLSEIKAAGKPLFVITKHYTKALFFISKDWYSVGS